MANILPPPFPAQQIPAPYPQAERESPAGSTIAGFQRPGPILPDEKGNLGFATMLPSDGFANHPDPNYKPIAIVKR
jgi:hypothetical protein